MTVSTFNPTNDLSKKILNTQILPELPQNIIEPLERVMESSKSTEINNPNNNPNTDLSSSDSTLFFEQSDSKVNSKIHPEDINPQIQKPKFNLFNILFSSREFDFQCNAFDFFRLFLALVVVVYHGFVVFYTNNGYSFFKANWVYFPFDMLSKEDGYTHIGSIAVLGFFIISGFLIARSAVYTKSWLEFFAKRFWRVYPGYIMSLFLACAFFAPLAMLLQNKVALAPQIASETWQFFIRNILIETPVLQIPTLTTGYFSGSYWTLLQEVRAYILIAGLGYFGFLKRKQWTLGLTLLTNILSAVVLYNDNFRKIWDLLFYDFRFLILFNYFLVGSCFFLYLNRIRWTWFSFTLSIILLYLGYQNNLMGIVGSIAGTYAILFLSQVLPFKNWAKRIGDWSYGVYVYSSPLQICLLFTPFGRTNFGVYLLVSLVLSLFCGYLSWNFWEKRFLKISKKTTPPNDQSINEGTIISQSSEPIVIDQKEPPKPSQIYDSTKPVIQSQSITTTFL